ncbi:hypothetical protein [Providencia burhodogranariea]|uniref:Uncharacterized protein n=1 Tax=Providencia burhodogranariea DSM 19968 TaxID=1141662 RepID=K8X873_9GAMM|nr:hypothetical protein [Providencia burhodogranariea]EKT64635.1 hypothetical protein OOA_02522 [Providencia burhodogranariea DSM 19968]
MKKPSKIWKEFSQIISIIDIGIGKQQRKLIKLNKQKELLINNINEFSLEIEHQQEKLKFLVIGKEQEAIKLFFKRKDNLKSHIESLFFDASLVQNELENLNVEIKKTEAEKLRLEKRKDILEELKKQII